MANSYNFNGLGLGLGNLSRLSNAKTRSISAENFTGEKGRGGMASEGTGAKAARDLGQGWKISPHRSEPGRRLQLILGDAIPSARTSHHRKPRCRRNHPLLPN